MSKVSLPRLILEMFSDLSLAKVVRVVLLSHLSTLFWLLYFTLTISSQYTTLLSFQEALVCYITYLSSYCLLYFAWLYFRFITVLDFTSISRGSCALLYWTFIIFLYFTALHPTAIPSQYSTSFDFTSWTCIKRLSRDALLNFHQITSLYSTLPCLTFIRWICIKRLSRDTCTPPPPSMKLPWQRRGGVPCHPR